MFSILKSKPALLSIGLFTVGIFLKMYLLKECESLENKEACLKESEGMHDFAMLLMLQIIALKWYIEEKHTGTFKRLLKIFSRKDKSD